MNGSVEMWYECIFFKKTEITVGNDTCIRFYLSRENSFIYVYINSRSLINASCDLTFGDI